MTRLLLALFGILAVTAFASRAAEPPSLKGTWVRESMGNQVVITFTDHRVTAQFRSQSHETNGQGRHDGWITIEFEGEYAKTDGGLIAGAITGMNIDTSTFPKSESLDELLSKSLTKMIGEPFCFRARVLDGALTVTDLKVPDVKIDDEHSSREMIAGFASGKYVSSPTENVPVPKLKAAKVNSQNHSHIIGDILGMVWNTCTPRSLPTTKNDLPSPRYLDHYPEYFQPDPAFPLAKENNSVPSNGNSTSAGPVLVTPHPVPSTMPAPLPMAPQPMPTAMPAPQPIQHCLSSELVPGTFFYFRPCHVTESFFIRMDETKLPITLPVTPAFVPQQTRSIYMLGGPAPLFASKVIVSIPCRQGVENMPIPNIMNITPCSAQFQETFMPQPQKDHLLGGSGVEPDACIRTEALMRQAETFRPIEGTWRRFWFNDMPQKLEEFVPANVVPTRLSPVASTETLMNQSSVKSPQLVIPLSQLPVSAELVDGGITYKSHLVRETLIREIDMGTAGTMQVIVRMKVGDLKPMPPPVPAMAPMRACPPETTICPTPSPLSLLPMQPPAPSPILPTAGQLMPPGSLRNQPIMPAIADAWKNSTRIEGGIMK